MELLRLFFGFSKRARQAFKSSITLDCSSMILFNRSISFQGSKVMRTMAAKKHHKIGKFVCLKRFIQTNES